MHLSGKTILITGGSSGIGLHLALLFISKGNTVIITGRSEELVAAAKSQEAKLITIRSDVAILDDVKDLHQTILKEHPSLSILVNNAGIMSEEQREAAIVNITSGFAFIPFPITPIYGTTKAGLHSFTECLRIQLKYSNSKVKVIEVAPPQAKTNLTKLFENPYEQGPLMTPQDVALAAFKGIKGEEDLVLPGLAKILRFMSRLAPAFMLNQLSKKTVPILLAKQETKASKET